MVCLLQPSAPRGGVSQATQGQLGDAGKWDTESPGTCLSGPRGPALWQIAMRGVRVVLAGEPAGLVPMSPGESHGSLSEVSITQRQETFCPGKGAPCSWRAARAPHAGEQCRGVLRPPRSKRGHCQLKGRWLASPWPPSRICPQPSTPPSIPGSLPCAPCRTPSQRLL